MPLSPVSPSHHEVGSDRRYRAGKDKGSALYGTFVDNLAKYEKRLKEKCGGDDPALRRQKRFTMQKEQ